ncbi:MAG: hypothetical protein GH158_00650 [Dehalococcoidia bacterium]|nr:hypothetical protein [Dehalococcoidia bacterium]
MANYEALKTKLQELVERNWDLPTIEARYRKMSTQGIPKRTLNREEILAHKQQILDRIQLRGEEYEYLSHN